MIGLVWILFLLNFGVYQIGYPFILGDGGFILEWFIFLWVIFMGKGLDVRRMSWWRV